MEPAQRCLKASWISHPALRPPSLQVGQGGVCRLLLIARDSPVYSSSLFRMSAIITTRAKPGLPQKPVLDPSGLGRGLTPVPTHTHTHTLFLPPRQHQRPCLWFTGTLKERETNRGLPHRHNRGREGEERATGALHTEPGLCPRGSIRSLRTLLPVKASPFPSRPHLKEVISRAIRAQVSHLVTRRPPG